MKELSVRDFKDKLKTMTYEQFVDFCWNQNADTIYIRARSPDTGKYESLNLREIGEEKAMEWINIWWAENRMPSRVLES